MDYSTASKAPRRTGPDVFESTFVADESLIADPRGEPRPRDIVEQRVQDLLGESPVHSGERKTRRRRSRAKPSATVPEKVGDLIGTVISPPPPPSSISQNQNKQSQEGKK